jgi:O-antigen/teichoic acid export membrane protein
VLNNILKMVIFGFLLFRYENVLMSAIYSFIASELISLVLRWVIIKKSVNPDLLSKIKMEAGERTNFLKYSTTVALISIVSLLMLNVDKLIISEYLDYAQVGLYKVSQNYVTLIAVFIAPFVAFWPVISKLYSDNKIPEIESEMKKIVRIITSLVIPMFFIFLFLSDRLLLIFGESYVSDESVTVLILLSFAFLIDAISGPIGSILTMTKHAKFILVNNVVSLLLNVVISLLLIDRLGIVGIAIGTGASLIFNNLISIIEVKILLGIFSYDYRNILQISTLAVFNYAVCFLLNATLKINNNYLFLIVYGGILYLLNGAIFMVINGKAIIRLRKI